MDILSMVKSWSWIGDNDCSENSYVGDSRQFKTVNFLTACLSTFPALFVSCSIHTREMVPEALERAGQGEAIPRQSLLPAGIKNQPSFRGFRRIPLTSLVTVEGASTLLKPRK